MTSIMKNNSCINLSCQIFTGLMTATNDKWRNRRRAITPTFHFTILNDFQKVFVKQAQILVEKLKKVADTDEMTDVQVPVSLAALDIICETAMGVSINAQSDSESEYVNAINSANTELQVRMRAPWYWPDFIYWNSTALYFSKDSSNYRSIIVVSSQVTEMQKASNL